MVGHKGDVKIKIGFWKHCNNTYVENYDMFSGKTYFHTSEVVIPWYVFPNDVIDLSKPLEARKNSFNGEWTDVNRFEISPDGIFFYDEQDALHSGEIENFIRNKPEASCDGKIVEIDGKKYKLTEVK